MRRMLSRSTASSLLGLAALAAVGAISSCADWKNTSSAQDDDELTAGRCGVERWSVKTGTDAQAGQVNLTPQDTTIAALGGLPAPSSLPATSRIAPTELQAVRLTNVTLTQYKLENDSDIHLVLTSGGSTMIAEIPDSGCVGSGSPFAAGIAAARTAFNAKFTVSGSFQSANIPVTLTGVPFFDAPHGQTGVAPNAIEVHSVLGICFGQDCGGGTTNTPDFSLAATPPSVGSSGGAAATSTVTASGSGGFAGSVALTASGVPAGANASFSSTSISAGSSAVLTLTPGSAAPGTYTIVIAGASSALHHSTTVSWTVASGTLPDFALNASPASVGSTGGATATSSIGVTGSSGFTGAVSLSTTGVPAGAQASFNASSVTAGNSATLTLAPGSAAAGSYTVTVTGTSASLRHTATIAWTISAGGSTTPPSVSIQTPAAGATVSGTVTIVANTVKGTAAVSRVEIYLDGALLGSAAGSQYSASWDTTTVANGAHALSARAFDSGGNSGTSADVQVTVSNSSTPPPGGTQELIVNGGFEQSLSPWQLGGAKLPIDSTMHAHSGRSSLRCGATYNEPNGDSYGYQSVDIPAGATSATLSFWYYPQTSDTLPYDYQEALVLDPNGNVLATVFHQADNSRVWTQASADLSRFAGQTVLVFFNVHSDGWTDPTALYIDDVSLLAGGSGGGGGDTTPPSAVVTAPLDGATVSGAVVLHANATDDTTVSKVDFLVDNALVGTATASPWATSWDTTAVGNGAHAIVARATDGAGNTASSAAISVTVNNGGVTTPPPTVAVVSPANGASVSGAVSISASASSSAGISHVDFLVDGAQVGTSSSAPYGLSWSSTTVPNGSHAISARAVDSTGQSATSATVNVNVSNTVTSPPPVAHITAPAAGATVSRTVSVTATATSSIGIARVEVSVDGALASTSTSAPYSFSWDTTGVANGSHTLTASAFDTAGASGSAAPVSVTVSNSVTPPPGGLHTVFVILMENHNWSSIKGSSSAPYINNTLLRQGAHAENYVNVPGIHPSEPNYIWLEAGTNFGVTTDSAPSVNHQSSTQHLVTQLAAAGKTWKAYEEGITGTSCPLTTSGLYAPKHLGMLFFDDVTNTNSSSSQNCIQHVRPYTELSRDLSGGTVANYNFITPNLCNDMHNSSGCASSDAVANGDNWLSANVPAILASAQYRNGGALFITWDESEGGDLPIGMIVMSPQAKAGYSNNVAYSHSSTLRTMQEIFQVSPFLGDAANATDLRDLFQTFP
jgi:hypothetical protein